MSRIGPNGEDTMVLVGHFQGPSTSQQTSEKQIKMVEEIAWEDNKIRGGLNMF